MQVNCFLDEGSDTTYVNEDVVEELGMKGRKEKVTINVANDQKVDLMPAITVKWTLLSWQRHQYEYVEA